MIKLLVAKSIVFPIVLILSACSDINQNTTIRITFPLTDDCVEFADNYVKSLRPSQEIGIKLIQFDKIIDEYPEIGTFVELTTVGGENSYNFSTQDKEISSANTLNKRQRLLAFANDIDIKCIGNKRKIEDILNSQ